MTSKAEEYQLKARECEQQTKEATHGLQKQVYAEFARQWREMAAQVEAPSRKEWVASVCGIVRAEDLADRGTSAASLAARGEA
jgi:hypothetical protein